jgi:hypothetical protein
MRNSHDGFDPAALKRLYVVFDATWDVIKDETPAADHDGVREAISKTIFGLARHGYSDQRSLERLAAYRAKQFIDLRA